MPGRPPKPTVLKVLEGNPGHRALPKNEPQPSVGLPDVPRWLDRMGVGFYTRVGAELVKMRVMTEADGEALAQAADAFSIYRKARRAFRGRLTYEVQTRNGKVIRAKPEVAMASDAHRRLFAFFSAFGLTPSARAKVQIAGPETKDDPLDEFFGEGNG